MSDRLGYPRPSYRPDRTDGIDPDMRRMAITAGTIGGVLALLFGAWTLFPRNHTEVPIIEAAAGPVRIKPDNPGGMTVLGGDEMNLNTQAGTAETLAPQPERPDIDRLRATQHPAAKHTPTQTPAILASRAPGHPGAPPIAAPAPIQKAAAFAKPEPVAPAETTGMAVQLAAFDTDAAARAAWKQLEEKSAELFASRKPLVLRAEVAGRTVWRLRTGGFKSVADAAKFCSQVRAQGEDCSIAAF